MKFGSILVTFLIFLTIFSNTSLSARVFNVGVSPGKIDLGEVERGSTELVNFYIVTPSEETLLVRLEPEKNSLEFFENNYKNLIYNYSEEVITLWVDIINNPVELEPSDETLKTNGGVIKGYRKVSFLIDIPKDAEPGYHTLSIKPLPLIPSETIGSVGSRVVAITSLNVLLDVTGKAIRKGVILDTEIGNYIGDNLEINTYFQNTGTTTISAKSNQKIYKKDGGLIKELNSERVYIEPKEIKILKTLLPVTGLSLGDYNVYTVVDYTTDSVDKNSVITITSPPPTSPVTEHEMEIFIPLVIITVIVLITIIIYRRKS